MGSIGKLVKNVLGGGTPTVPANTAGLSAEKLDLLRLDLSQLKPDDSAFTGRALRFVVEGQDEAVLSELARSPDAARQLRLACCREFLPSNDFRSRFFSTVEPAGIETYLRLAKLYESAAKGDPKVTYGLPAAFAHVRWLEIVVEEATGASRHSWPMSAQNSGLTCTLLEKMLVADGEDPQLLLKAILEDPQAIFGLQEFGRLSTHLADIGDYLTHQAPRLVPLLVKSSAKTRIRLLELLSQSKASLDPFVDGLVHCGVDSAKTVREAAEAMLATAADAARPGLEATARDGSRTEREQAVRLLGNICRAEARPFLEERLAAETSAPVKEAIEKVLGNIRPPQVPASKLAEPPPHVPLPPDSLVTPPLRAFLARMFKDYNDHAARHNEQVANKSANTHIYPPGKLDVLVEKDLDEACRLLQNGGDVLGYFSKTLVYLRIHEPEPKGAFKAFLEHPDCRLIHVIRLLAMINELGTPNRGYHGMMWQAGFRVGAFRRTHEPRITLRQVAEAIRAVGLSDGILVEDVLAGFERSFEWEPEAVWPFLYDHLPRLEKAFDPPSGDWSVRWQQQREFDGALRVLARFPQVPPVLVGKLWDLATGTIKANRLRAQKAIEKLPDLLERLTQALASGNYQTRSIAAEWLGRRGDKRAVAALDAAARKEKQDAALDEILTALEKLGEPIEPYLDREKLKTDAAKGLKKGIPEALAWFPWAGLPNVHWSDTGEEIPAEVITWLIVQNFKLKSAEAGPLLRRYCALIVPGERDELGRFVLAAWLDQDLKRKHTDAEARKLAKQQAPQMWQTYQNLASYYQKGGQSIPASFPQSLQQAEEQTYLGLRRECGSAVAEKGVLAVAGACGSDAAVPPVQRYLKEWYGFRAAQCKALIAMLSAVDRPAAIQYLLSIANRFRTKGIREEAEKYVNLLAERKGWTLDELADRTMPTAGFDDEGTLELSFGPRQFTARVNSDLEAVLSDGAGKVVKNLPDPRQDDDADLAKAAKATFSAAKKELKKFAGMQATRLYEAMCTERTWPAADWRMYLAGHPLLKFLCQRVVWAVWEDAAAFPPLPLGEGRGEGRAFLQDRFETSRPQPNPLPEGEGTRAGRSEPAVTKTFRPLDDGTLTDFEDGEVALAEGATIRIAHGCQLSDAVAEAWKKHLADYDVVPLFTQSGRAAYTLPAEKRNETSIDDFQGHMVEAFKLRGMATKCGYTRGQAQDGGWFYDYQKTFPGLGLIVQLNFSGNGLPEENRPVALTNLSFQKSAPQEAGFMMQGATLPLGEIPAVLLTECYNDLASIARTGSGFDPEWEKKVY